MKTRLGKLKKLLERLLFESTCPECGRDGAYVGLNDVECKNPRCRHFSGENGQSVKTRTKRVDPNSYSMVKDWGWHWVPWPEFVERFPHEAEAWVHVLDWSVSGDHVPTLDADALWDDEPFVSAEGTPVIYGNITGPGGSMFMAWMDGVDHEEWMEADVDEATGEPQAFVP